MTGPELRALLKQLDLRQVGLAERLGVSPVTVHRWLSGDLAVPQYVVAYLELKLSFEAPCPHGIAISTMCLACNEIRELEALVGALSRRKERNR